jgi:Flp pilus assembly pilin Flp
MDCVQRFWLDESGQDLIEYSLLLVFIALATIVVLRQTGAATTPIWSATNSTIAVAASSVS